MMKRLALCAAGLLCLGILTHLNGTTAPTAEVVWIWTVIQNELREVQMVQNILRYYLLKCLGNQMGVPVGWV